MKPTCCGGEGNFGFGPEAVVLRVKEQDYVLPKIALSTISLVEITMDLR